MSKELEALRKLSGLARDKHSNNEVEPLFNILETTLKEIEEYITISEEEHEELMMLQSQSVQKQLKALKIIKEKRVNVSWLVNVSFCSNIGLQSYNQHNKKSLTQEEYDLLKEVLL